METSRRHWAILSKKDIENIYYYEDAFFNLKNKAKNGSLSSDANVYYLMIQQNSHKLCNRLIKAILNALNSWGNFHAISFSEAGFEGKYASFLSDEEFKIVSKLHTLWILLNNASADNAKLEDKFLAINYALHVVHFEINDSSPHKGSNLIGIGDQEFSPQVYTSKYNGDYLSEIEQKSRQLGMPIDELTKFLSDLSNNKYHHQYQEWRNQKKACKNWYKIAKIQKKALKINDLEEFYLISSITKDKMLYLLKNDEDFKNYIIKKMEYFKTKYLQDGVRAINEELSYIHEEVDTSLNGLYKALNLFKDTKRWEEIGTCFGGVGWSRITDTLIEIMESPNLYQINFNDNESLLINIYKLIFLIDHFNNISHNTGLALPKMMDKYQNISNIIKGTWDKVKDKNLLKKYREGLISFDNIINIIKESQYETLEFLDMKKDVNTDMREILISPIKKFDKELVNALNEVGESIQFLNKPQKILNYYKSKGQLTYEVFNKIFPSLFSEKNKHTDYWRLSEEYPDFFNMAILDAIKNKNIHLILDIIINYSKFGSSVKSFINLDELLGIFIEVAEEIGYNNDINWLDFKLLPIMDKKNKELIFEKIFKSSIIMKDFDNLYKYLMQFNRKEYQISPTKFIMILNTIMNLSDRFSAKYYNILNMMLLTNTTYEIGQVEALYNALSQTLLETNPSFEKLIVLMEVYCYKINLNFGSKFWEVLFKRMAFYIKQNPHNENILQYTIQHNCQQEKKEVIIREIEKYL